MSSWPFRLWNLTFVLYFLCMDLVLLAGNSAENKEWIEEVRDALKPLFDTCVIQYYKHWKAGEPLIDLDYELDVLVNLVKGFDEHSIFAKSAGVVLTVKGVHERKIKPSKCIFVGTPIPWARALGENVDAWFKNFFIPALFIQQTHDPAFHYKDLEEYVEEMKMSNAKLVELSGDNHHYEDVPKIKKFVGCFLEAKPLTT